MIEWPAALVNEIARGRAVLFLGAGVSASAKDRNGNRPPDWPQFLEKACELIKDADRRNKIKTLLAERKYLVALQAIKDTADDADYHVFLDRHFNSPQYEPSDLHKVINDLDVRLVITTNFDKIYERYCFSFTGSGHAFKTITYTGTSLGDELRSDTRLIIKAHGTIDNIGDMIFTKAQYHKAKRDFSHFYDVLKAVFLTNTIIFLGCGLEDPDIMLLLEDVRIAGRQNKPHYALVKKGADEFFIRDWRSTYNIQVLEYEPNHEALIPELRNLLDQVDGVRAELAGNVRAGM